MDTNSDEVKEEDDQELIINPFEETAQSISEVSDDIRVCTNPDSSIRGSNIHGKLVRVCACSTFCALRKCPLFIDQYQSK